MSGDAYAGLKRRKQTPWSVRFGDALVSRLIAVGGIGTIAAILLVVLVLVATAFPLLNGPTQAPWTEFDSKAYQHFGIDEHGLVLWGMTTEGDIEVRGVNGGELLAIYPGEFPSAISSSYLSIDRRTLVLGLADGSLQTATLNFETSLLSPSALPEGMSLTEAEPLDSLGSAVYRWFDAAGVRRTELSEVEWSEPISIADQPLLAIDYVPSNSSNRLASTTKAYALAVAGEELVFATITGKKNMMTRKFTETVVTAKTGLRNRSASGKPLNITMLNGESQAVVTWTNGILDRFSLSGGQPEYRESQDGVIGGGKVTCATPLLARQTLLCGVDDGRLLGWMVTRTPASESENDVSENGLPASDGSQLSLAHETMIGPAAIRSISSSEQSHLAVVSDADNQTSLVYVTTETLLDRSPAQLSSDIRSVGLDPSGKVLMAATDSSIALAEADLGYPEASFKAFFQRVWYEGHDRPKFIWQSSAGSEKSEIKLSLMPLIFGTLKATVYAMLISVPLAILAAIYTSEFLPGATRTRIKPVIELMASLPSVVLGYVAALVAAPYLQENLATVLVGLLCFPLTFVLAGSLWNLLPIDRLVQLQRYRMLGLLFCLPVAYWLSVLVGMAMERIWFGGNLLLWLTSRNGSATGGWMLLLVPVFTIVAALVVMGPLTEWTRRTAVRSTPRTFAIVGCVRLLVTTGLVLLAAWATGMALDAIGWDLRGSLFTSYQDRNALLVGGALGFCVIPIIYTIADDALQAVPQQLRSASLGCGATPWQTAVRVVVPSAMSGLFSAVMIGLGRAVGETMVVLMAAGNTPLMEWNPFNGFRTLSATLATELPEAAKGSTHFRTLFLAALLLFFFTLVANTLAEIVRIRFRKRASQL